MADQIQAQPTEIWLAHMPECFGYGLMVLDTSEDGARRKLKAAYLPMAKRYQFGQTFDRAMEYFGGTIAPVELGKVYNDNFNY